MQFVFCYNNIIIRNHKPNNKNIQDFSLKYSSNASNTYTNKSNNPIYGRLILEEASLNEKLEQTNLKITIAKISF
jgi:hypothetical protein